MITKASLPWGFRAQLSREHDGDSFWVLCDSGFRQRYEPELRLDGVHAPEIRPMQPGGPETTAYINGWLKAAAGAAPRRRWPLWVDVVMVSTFEPEMDSTLERFVASVWKFDDTVGQPGGGRVGAVELSINYAVNTFLSGHPEWGHGV